MKVTLYRENGVVEREFECDQALNRETGWATFIKGGEQILYATMPYSFVTQAVRKDQQWRVDKEIAEGTETWDVSMRLGDTLREWNGVRAWGQYGRMVTFWHEGKWWDVVGQVMVEKSNK